MAVYKGKKADPTLVEVCAVGAIGGELDSKLKDLNAGGWNIRQIYQEESGLYRIFAQRETPAKK